MILEQNQITHHLSAHGLLNMDSDRTKTAKSSLFWHTNELSKEPSSRIREGLIFGENLRI